MKISFVNPNNSYSSSQKQNITFEAGLTAQFAQEIKNANVVEISNRLAQKGIENDFKSNKIIAWCCDKTVDIFEQHNKQFSPKLALPKGLFVEDFADLNINDDLRSTPSFCNFTLRRLKRNSNEISKPGTLFFNSYETYKKECLPQNKWLMDWNCVSEISDDAYASNLDSTSHFLRLFLHEFSHNVHLDKLTNEFKVKILEKIRSICKDKKQIEEYQKKYGQKVSQICKYALKNPLEAIACDMSRAIVDSLDKTTLKLTKNPFINTPYEELSASQKANLPVYSQEDLPLKEILRNIWNGKFD